MATRDENEKSLFGVVSDQLKSWLSKVRDVVMAPWIKFKIQPDPSNVYTTQDAWNASVDTILTEIGKISLDAWSQASDVPPVSRHAFVMAELAQVRNLLVRIPDEVHDLIVAKIIDTVNGGGDNEAVAQAVEEVLNWTGSENWPNRSRVIAITETTRAYGAGTLGAGLEQQRVTGKPLMKRWVNEHDSRVRLTHREVSNAPIPLSGLFRVGNSDMMYPGDPSAPVGEVAGCRCDLIITDGSHG